MGFGQADVSLAQSCLQAMAGYAATVQPGDPRPGPSRPALAPPNSDDERLVRALVDGDRDALGALYDRHAASMLAVAQRVLGSPREAEDLVHDVFLEAWHRARYYEPARGTVRTWLMMRLRSRAIDRQRSAQRNKRVELDAAAQIERDAHAHARASTESAGSHDGGTLRGFLLELSAEHQAVLELGYFSGLSCAEIATRLDVPIGTVKSRMSRAIAQLRTRLQDADDGGAP
jgi:RNA polymerase sigma-70 factor (ECF subfamily)